MRCPLGAAGSGHSPAWRRMLLTGSLLAFFASSELPSSAFLDPLTEGADAHLPVPRSLDGVLSTSWFRGHKAQPEAMIFSPEGLPGPGHTGRETLDTQGSLVIRNVTTQDAGSYTVVLETSRGRRSVTEQIQVNGERGPMAGGTPFSVSRAHRDPFCHQSSLANHPTGRGGTGTGERGRSWGGDPEDVEEVEWWEWGVWREGVSSSLSPSWFPEAVVDPTDPVPSKPKPTLSLSGSSAFALTVAAPVILVGSTVFTIIWKLSYLPSLLPIHSAPTRCRAHSASKTEAKPTASSQGA
nr:LOW QUALITY PROTEIN: immunoglobulin superfamily member 23-like [Kogia breviceps]